ncbi:MAG TPA: STAS domain-containing protein [Planctomycetota bacterium]
MFRIRPECDGSHATLHLEGRIGAVAAAELEQLCRPLLARRPALQLDGITFVDAAGLACLCRLLAQGARPVGGSAYITQVLRGCSP